MSHVQKIRIGAGFVFALFAFLGQEDCLAANTDNKTVTITASIPDSLTLACPNPGALTIVTPGTPVSVQAACTATTNGQNGFNLKARVSTPSGTAAQTLVSGTTWIPNSLTGYVAANPTTWVNGTTRGLGFRVAMSGTTNLNTINSDWTTTPGVPATADLAANAKFAAFPIADTTIYNYATYIPSGTAPVNMEYKLDVVASQKSGAYSGTVVYTGTTN